MIERLPTPWGLVRLGVAPDHPNIKAVSRRSRRSPRSPGFRFLGNVEVGRDLTHDDLVALYDAVVYAVGAQTDRRLGIPGEDLPGSWPATEFVAWYNGHPDFQDLAFDLSGERAVVVGNGNVAVDVARMLALAPEEICADRHDRRGDRGDRRLRAQGDRRARPPRPGAGRVHDARAEGARRARRRRRRRRPGRPRARPGERGRARGATRTPRRNVEVLREYAARDARGQAAARSGCASASRRSRSSARTASRRSRSCATSSSPTRRAGSGAVPTDERETIPCGIVFRSVGYRGVALPGVPFDEERGDDPERRRPRRRRDGEPSRASTAPAGSSAARAA